MRMKLFHSHTSQMSLRQDGAVIEVEKNQLYWLGMILFWTAFLTLITSFTIEGSAQSLSFDANKNGWQAGILINGGFLSQAFGAIVFGWLGDHIGRFRPLIYALLVAGIGGICASIAWSFPAFIVFRYVQSFGVGALLPLVLTILTDLVKPSPGSKQLRTILLLAAWYAWGTFFMSVIANFTITVLGASMGWRVLHILGSMGLLACSFACYGKCTFNRQNITSMTETSQESLVTLLFSSQRNQVLLLWFQWFLAYFLVTAYSNGLPFLFKHFGLQDVSVLATIGYGCMTICVLYIFAYGFHIGGYQRWMQAGYLIALATIVMVGNGLLFSLSSKHTLFWVSTGVSLGSFVIVYGLYQSGFLFPKAVRSRGLAVARVFQCLATILAPMTTPVLYGSMGIDSVLFFWFILAFLGWGILHKLSAHIHKGKHDLSAGS